MTEADFCKLLADDPRAALTWFFERKLEQWDQRGCETGTNEAARVLSLWAVRGREPFHSFDHYPQLRLVASDEPYPSTERTDQALLELAKDLFAPEKKTPVD